MTPEPAGAPARRPTEVAGITGLRLLPQNAPASLVNMSSSGVLVESSARLPVGASVTVAFEGGFTPATAVGRVARCEVAVMARDGRLRYHIGVQFDTPLPLDETAAAADAAPPASPYVQNRW